MRSGKPRILFLSRNCPYGESFGGQLRTLHIARHLRQCGDLEMGLVLLTDPGKDALAQTAAEFSLASVMRMVHEPIRGLGRRLRHELDPFFLNTEGWRLNDDDAGKMAAMIAKYDLVWIHNLAVANGARIKLWPRSVLDIDDLRTGYHQSAVNCAISWGERAKAMRQAWLWKRRESILFRRFGIVVVCSESDRALLGHPHRTRVIPNGFEVPTAQPQRRPADPPRIGFIGLFRYPPNLEGVRWFVSDVWPKIKQAHPSVRLRLVGAGLDSKMAGISGPDIDVLGWVDDSAAEISTWSTMIVPIRVGGGTRIKIAEGFGRRCPVVSTTLGAFGYDVQSGNEILLADQPQEFAAACLSILADRRLADGLADRAWEKYCQQWTWEAMGPRVAETVQDSLELSEIVGEIVPI